MTLREYVRLLRRGWLLVAVLTVLGIGAANVLTLLTTPTYTSTASILVSLRGDNTTAGLQQAASTTQQRAPTYASLARSDVVLQAAAEAARTSVRELRASTSAVAREGEAYLDIVAQADTAQGAQVRAQAVADALSRQAPASDTPGTDPPLVLDVVTPAQLPEEPESPRARNNLAFGAIIGLALGIGAVVVAHALDNRIRSISDLPRGLQLATVTSLPLPRSLRGRQAANDDFRLESFRHLRANLQFGTRTGGLIAVAGVTSVSQAQGVATQLATVLGEIKLAAVVVDVDLRPRPAADRGVEVTPAPAPGVADVLSGAASVDHVVRPSAAAGVWSISAGAVQDTSAQQLSTAPMRQLLQALASRYDYVLLACPPVIERSEASVVAALSHSTLLVVESGSTTRSELVYALELLDGVGATSVSVALDHVRGRDLGLPPLSDPIAPESGAVATR